MTQLSRMVRLSSVVAVPTAGAMYWRRRDDHREVVAGHRLWQMVGMNRIQCQEPLVPSSLLMRFAHAPVDEERFGEREVTAWGSMHAGVAWSLFLFAWGLTMLTPLVLMYWLASAKWSYLAGYSLFWLGVVLEWIKLPYMAGCREYLVENMTRWFGEVSVAFNEDVGSSERTLYCVHPHGIFSFGFFLLYMQLLKLGLRPVMLGAPYVQWFCPTLRLLFGIVGVEFASASKAEVNRVLTEGRNACLMIGGFEEATITELGQERLFLLNRKGFIKYALRHGYSVTPVYCFGENDLYWNARMAMPFRLWLSSGVIQLPGVIPWGNSLLPWLPRSVSQYKVVVGSAIKLPHITKPTDDQVTQYHAAYVDELTDLFNHYRLNKTKHLQIA